MFNPPVEVSTVLAVFALLFLAPIWRAHKLCSAAPPRPRQLRSLRRRCARAGARPQPWFRFPHGFWARVFTELPERQVLGRSNARTEALTVRVSLWFRGFDQRIGVLRFGALRPARPRLSAAR